MLNINRGCLHPLRTRQLRSIKIGKSRRITDQHLAGFIASLEDNGAASRQRCAEVKDKLNKLHD